MAADQLRRPVEIGAAANYDLNDILCAEFFQIVLTEAGESRFRAS